MDSLRNPCVLSERLPNAMLLVYPDASHGSLFRFHDSFVRQTAQCFGFGNRQLTLARGMLSKCRKSGVPADWRFLFVIRLEAARWLAAGSAASRGLEAST
jgi:hypothetical protein